VLKLEEESRRSLGARVLGDGLRAFADSVLGQLAGQQETDGSLDLSARDGRAAIVVSQTRRLGGNALEDVVDKAVHDAHGLARNARVGVDLLEHFVDVDAVALLPPLPLLLVARAGGLCLCGGFLRTFRRWLRRHCQI
jgi:hypothetical protein